MKHRNEQVRIAIIGGGVAGTSSALYFGQMGLNVTLFEKEASLISGPPWCHLHAGGNLYREISDVQCVTLLKQSIDFLRFYPFVVDYRPTVIVLPKTDSSTPQALLPRLKLLSQEYLSYIKLDSQNEVLGKPENYYQIYTKEKIVALKMQQSVNSPKTSDEWMIPVAKNIDMDKVQFPLIMVQEYGLNLFRLAAGSVMTLENLDTVTLHTQSIVHNVQKNFKTEGWDISYVKEDLSHTQSFDYLINAAGFRTGKIDDLLGAPCKSMVEFKAAYVSHWDRYEKRKFPEIVFHGERGTPQGMGQFTPYPEGYFQLHGMTHDITLYEDGLVANSLVSCQPRLGQEFIDKIEKSWTKEEIKARTEAAIKHLSQYIPSFASATVGAKPLFGAQQIPGDDPTLRVAEVSFPREQYARCEIVKVSSVLDMIDAIAEKFVALGYLDKYHLGQRTFAHPIHLNENELTQRAQEIAVAREYPAVMAKRTTPDSA
ncbi:MAG: FAD-dependent oxidoreductase [Campylobacterota bacterium]|nr:FAD-dependent oxidoreductase [Campylobacterota bacterium]